MGDHYGIDVGRDCGTERDQFDLVKAIDAGVGAGEGQVGICVGVAMAWKVLDCGEHACAARAFDVSCDQLPDLSRIFAE